MKQLADGIVQLVVMHVHHGVDEAMITGRPYGKPSDFYSWLLSIWLQLALSVVLTIAGMLIAFRKLQCHRIKLRGFKRLVHGCYVVLCASMLPVLS